MHIVTRTMTDKERGDWEADLESAWYEWLDDHTVGHAKHLDTFSFRDGELGNLWRENYADQDDKPLIIFQFNIGCEIGCTWALPEHIPSTWKKEEDDSVFCVWSYAAHLILDRLETLDIGTYRTLLFRDFGDLRIAVGCMEDADKIQTCVTGVFDVVSGEYSLIEETSD